MNYLDRGVYVSEGYTLYKEEVTISLVKFCMHNVPQVHWPQWHKRNISYFTLFMQSSNKRYFLFSDKFISSKMTGDL